MSRRMFPSSDNSFSSLTGFLKLFRSMLHDFVPVQLRSYFSGLLSRFFTRKSKYPTVVIDEKFRNKVFHAAEMYLRKKLGLKIYFIIHSVALVVMLYFFLPKKKNIRLETERVRAGKTPKAEASIPPTFVPREAETYI